MIEVRPEFERRLAALINEYSLENESDTPDFILARYLIFCLNNWNNTHQARTRWYADGDVTK